MQSITLKLEIGLCEVYLTVMCSYVEPNSLRMFSLFNFRYFNYVLLSLLYIRAKGDWDFQICDLVKNPDETDI